VNAQPDPASDPDHIFWFLWVNPVKPVKPFIVFTHTITTSPHRVFIDPKSPVAETLAFLPTHAPLPSVIILRSSLSRIRILFSVCHIHLSESPA
jgi:hypothetical protein